MPCATVMLHTLVRWGYRRFGWVLGISRFLIVTAHETALVGSFRPEAARPPSAEIPATVEVFVWACLVPVVPVMCAGQVWLYRMTRRPAGAPAFFA